MKNLMKASLLAVAMSATSVWAEFAPTMIYGEPVGQEALVVANMVNSDPIKVCLDQVQNRFRGDIVIEDIKKLVPNSYNKFIIQAAVLVGGDAFVGSAEIYVQRTVGIPWGVHYQCRVLANDPPPGTPTNPVVDPTFPIVDPTFGL